MIETLMRLKCDGEHGIPIVFPPDGYMEIDAITTKRDLRKKGPESGWLEMQLERRFLRDVCTKGINRESDICTRDRLDHQSSPTKG